MCRDYEYKRLGTLSLLAGIDLLTGQAIPVVSETHKSSDFICLLKKFDELYPEGDVIRIICDNHSAHKSKEVQNYLATRPEGRFVFVFTPTHGSWLNLIESFFSKMTKQMLKGIRVKSKEELAEIADKSVTQTLSRSINTSVTTFVMVLLLYIMGVASIKDFSLPLMVGIVAGLFSSVCISTNLWFDMKVFFHKGSKKK